MLCADPLYAVPVGANGSPHPFSDMFQTELVLSITTEPSPIGQAVLELKAACAALIVPNFQMGTESCAVLASFSGIV